MARVNQHLRNTFLAGIFAGVPLAVTVFIVWWIDDKTSPLADKITRVHIPLVGIVMALLSIYLLGLVVSSFFGRYILSVLDGLLLRTPFIKPIYEAWKQVSLTPGGREGMFARVVLVPVEKGDLYMLGFTSGEPIPGNPEVVAVLVPNSPNPITGRLYFAPLSVLRFVDISPEEALKAIVSTGNYVPERISQALKL